MKRTKRTVSGVAFILAVVVGCLFSSSRAFAVGCPDPGPLASRVCQPGFMEEPTGANVAKDINGDGSVCRFLFLVTDNNVLLLERFGRRPIRCLP